MIKQSRLTVDLRYDSFFASILTEHHLKFPQNLRIISWNYDSQLEMAYSSYSTDRRNEACQCSLNIAIKNCRTNDGYEGFSVTKLNGTASVYIDDKYSVFHIIQDVKAGFSKDFLYETLKKYAVLSIIPETRNKTESSLSFAWEKPSYSSSIIDTAIKNTNDTEILVVIGYSFPFFNREVDRKIIKAMTNLKRFISKLPMQMILKSVFWQ